MYDPMFNSMWTADHSSRCDREEEVNKDTEHLDRVTRSQDRKRGPRSGGGGIFTAWSSAVSHIDYDAFNVLMEGDMRSD